MSLALARNAAKLSADVELLVANCLAHDALNSSRWSYAVERGRPISAPPVRAATSCCKSPEALPFKSIAIRFPAEGAERTRWTQTQREQLTSVVRYHKVSVVRALRTANSKGMDFQSLSYRFDQSNGISAYGMWFKEDNSPDAEPVTVVLNDEGYKAAGQQVYDNLSSGHDVLALDLLFTGASRPDASGSSDWEVLVDSSGERCLGMEAAQLLSIVQWLHSERGARDVQVQTKGIRSQVVALIAAALDPPAFSSLSTEGGMHSLSWLLQKPIPFRSAPDLFCLDLYKDFDIDSLSALAAPLKIAATSVVGQ